jgi:hypothetical protein
MRIRGRTPEPVFVDRTGRRRRLLAVTGAAGGLVLALAALMLVAGFTGIGEGNLPALPAPAASKVPRAVTTTKPSATIRPPGQTRAPATTGPADPGAPGATSAVTPASTTAQAGVTPSPTHTNNGRAATHPPRHKPTKGT